MLSEGPNTLPAPEKKGGLVIADLDVAARCDRTIHRMSPVAIRKTVEHYRSCFPRVGG